MSRASDYEMRLVAEFFGDTKGYFVEVGANDPRERSQTWHLEQNGWTGILIEPSKLRRPEEENGWPRRLGSDLSLDKEM